MFKNFPMALFIGAALFSTQSFAELKKKAEEHAKQMAEKNAELEAALKNRSAQEITGRHIFPIYQTQSEKNPTYFVAIRTQGAGLQSHVIDAPNSESSKSQIWNVYTQDLAQETQGQSAVEFQDALNSLDESNLVGFYVFASKSVDAEAYFMANEDFLAAVQVSSPYFDNTLANPTSDVDSYGVVFQTNPARSLALGMRLMKLVKAEEAARSSNKDL